MDCCCLLIDLCKEAEIPIENISNYAYTWTLNEFFNDDRKFSRLKRPAQL